MSDTEPFSSGSSDIYQPLVYESCSTSSDDDGSDVGLLTFQNQTNEANDKGMNILDEFNTDNPCPSTSGIAPKKRKSANPSQWKRNVIKKSIATGKGYLNYKGREIGERKTGPDCCCKKYKCFVQINEEDRKLILENFNKLEETYVQNVYLGGLIKTENVERERSKTGTGKKRSCSHKYYIKLGNRNIQICRNGFASIHGISKKRVDNVAKEYRDPTVTTPAQSNRGKHQNRPNRIPSEWVSKVDSHIRSFPRRESHYSRNKSSRYYLSPVLNIKRMYELYLKKHELGLEASAKPIVSFDFYYRYFKQNFKYSFGSPRSDTCKKCDMLSNKLKDKTLDSDETQKIQIEKSLHQAKADTFFVDLKEKSQLALNNEECEVLTFDYQQNMPLPKVPAVSVTTGTPVFDYFPIMRNAQAQLSVLPQKPLHDHALPLKKAKYNDVMQLVKNYVPPNKLYFYRALKSEAVGPTDDISSEDDDDQAEVNL
ncbi:unnamed protein product [Parnassius apollo]|uniref:(apollo) hypothetical protein n=1 Tax=Parnassius apollo TaxID=110799 RepID=A0A8S3W0J3_PARAO|nr:unnamed protein product [Parnassius apollo]